jgi:mRNA-degrading endonuclease RelE of RelBE toxin-antitoxin system
MGYTIRFSRKAEKIFKKIPRNNRIRIEKALQSLADDIYSHHDVVRIKGSPKEMPSYRIRVGEYRASFIIWNNVMLIYVFDIGKKENYEYR